MRWCCSQCCWSWLDHVLHCTDALPHDCHADFAISCSADSSSVLSLKTQDGWGRMEGGGAREGRGFCTGKRSIELCCLCKQSTKISALGTTWSEL